MTPFESLPEVCPNCFELADGGLYSAELFQITHCGCFYEGGPTGKLFHISTEPELTQEEYEEIGAEEAFYDSHAI